MAFGELAQALNEHDAAVDAAVAREDRRACLDAALRMTETSDHWGSTEVLEFAEYIRTGAVPDLSLLADPDVES
jgi:hypothetical protein